MTNINLTAPLIDRNLTAPERSLTDGDLALIVYNSDTRITRGGNTRITRGGNIRIARNTEYGYPFLLNSVLIDRNLTSPERY